MSFKIACLCIIFLNKYLKIDATDKLSVRQDSEPEQILINDRLSQNLSEQKQLSNKLYLYFSYGLKRCYFLIYFAAHEKK